MKTNSGALISEQVTRHNVYVMCQSTSFIAISIQNILFREKQEMLRQQKYMSSQYVVWRKESQGKA